MLEKEKGNTLQIVAKINKRTMMKYHKMLDLSGSKIDFSPNLTLLTCNDVKWIEGDDLHEVIYSLLKGLKFDCKLKNFSFIKKENGDKSLVLKVELPSELKKIKQEVISRVKNVGTDMTDYDSMSYILVSEFKEGNPTPTLPRFDHEIIKVEKVRMLYTGIQAMEKEF